MADKRLRARATSVMTREDKVLLVKYRGKRRLSLPGGAIKGTEPVVCAAARELHEELGVEAVKITRLPKCDFADSSHQHRVCLVEADGEPMLRRLEVDSFTWWDMKGQVPAFPHVTAILKRLKRL